MGNSGTALGIIGIILGAVAIGFAFFVWNGQNTSSSVDQTIVVGVWNRVDDNLNYAPHNLQDDWLVELKDNVMNNTEYLSFSNTNTRITLLRAGWYRIHLHVLLQSISTSETYSVNLLKDGVSENHFDFIITPSSIGTQFMEIDSSLFVYSDGTSYIECNGVATENFYPYMTTPDYSQFTIEYVAV